MKSLFYLIICALLIATSCKKKIQSPNGESNKIMRNYHHVYLDTNHRVVRIHSMAANNDFVKEANYTYLNNKAIKTFSDSANTFYKLTYYLGSNGFAAYSIDTIQIPANNYFKVDSTTYTYDSTGYLLESNRFSDNNHQVTEYNNHQGDLIGIGDWDIEYYDTTNKVELYWFYHSNGIVGRKSTHLIKKIERHLSGGTESTSYFKYELDANGYLTKRIETTDPHKYVDSFSYTFNY